MDEIGVWEEVEAANFPIKVGATYRWGKSPELWDFDFVPMSMFDPAMPRPGRYEGQRTKTAFQVDRSAYDEILLDHAAELGCEVRESTRVVRIHRDGDRVTGLELDSGEIVAARWYVDASGHASPGDLGAQRLGLVYPSRPRLHERRPHRARGALQGAVEAARRIYADALAEDPRLAGLLRNATSEGKLQTTKDWSFLSGRHAGENWFLVGEASGFADPILAAGMSISQASAREAAFTILEIDRGGDAEWLKSAYGERQSTKIRNHIRFADY